MKAIILKAFGGPHVLHIEELPRPSPGVGEALVKVAAVGVCHHDVMHRTGKLKGADIGVVLGHEISGEVVEVGEGVATHGVGDRVVVYQRRFCGHCRDCLRGRQDLCRAHGRPALDVVGGCAEFIAIAANCLIPIPDELDFVSAALASCPIATSYRALITVAGILPGESVLITGASGGLGLHQLQLARAVGAHSLAITSSPDKAPLLRHYGADEVIVARDGEFSAEVWRATGKQGVDVAIDNLGSTLGETLRSLAASGRAVVLGNIDAASIALSAGLLIARRLTLSGSGMAVPEEVRRAVSMVASGQIEAVVAQVLPFSAVVRAHELLDARAVTGRIVLQGW